MSVVFNLFEIAVNCFQGFLMVYFPFKFLGGKFSDRFINNYGVMFSTILAAIITIFNYITIFENILAFSYILLLFAYSHLCLKGKIIYKVYASIFPILISIVVSVFTSSLSSVLFDKPVSEIIVQQNWQRIVSVLITQLIIFYLVILSLKVFNRNKDSSYQLSRSEWLLITFTLLLSIMLGTLLMFISFENISGKGRVYVVLGIICILMINIIDFYLVIDLGKKNVSKIMNEKLKMQIAYNEQYVKNADTEYDLIQKLRHDSKAIYQVLGDLLSNGKIEKANDYLNKLTDIVDDKIIFINTDNSFVNSIINAKLTIAKSFGIKTSCLCVKSFNGIDDIDLCRLLSNMLDNAIRATSRVGENDKRISVSISEDVGTYSFIVSNTIDKSVLEYNPELKTTKNNSSESGYGTGIIKDIARKYNGEYDFYEKDKTFYCSVILNSE